MSRNSGTGYAAVIKTDLDLSNLAGGRKTGRSRVAIKHSGRERCITVTSTDLSSFKASLNSILRDLTVIESVSKASKRASSKT